MRRSARALLWRAAARLWAVEVAVVMHQLSGTEVAAIITAWTQTHTDLVQRYAEQGRRWQSLDLHTTAHENVDRYVSLVAEELTLVEQTLIQAEQLKTRTIRTVHITNNEW